MMMEIVSGPLRLGIGRSAATDDICYLAVLVDLALNTLPKILGGS